VSHVTPMTMRRVPHRGADDDVTVREDAHA